MVGGGALDAQDAANAESRARTCRVATDANR
jgi:hypothetical protein